MTDKEEFWNVKKKISQAKELTSKRIYHPYVNKFMDEWMVIFAYGTYITEGEINSNFASSEIWNLMHNVDDKSVLCESESSIRKKMINCMNVLNYLQTQINNPLTIN